MTPLAVLILAVYLLTGAIAAEAVARRKGRAGGGFALGLLLGWIGVAIIAFMPPTRDMQVQRERERQQIRREAAGS
jgi:NhaP-type Na+/H+ or K+/H+ antiporter